MIKLMYFEPGEANAKTGARADAQFVSRICSMDTRPELGKAGVSTWQGSRLTARSQRSTHSFEKQDVRRDDVVTLKTEVKTCVSIWSNLKVEAMARRTRRRPSTREKRSSDQAVDATG